jgi:hypothetical protein
MPRPHAATWRAGGLDQEKADLDASGSGEPSNKFIPTAAPDRIHYQSTA